jgi:FkbM family methyltransferase
LKYTIHGRTFEATPESCDVFNSFLPDHPAANDRSAWGMVAEMRTFVERTKDKKKFLDVGSLFGIYSLVFTDSKDKEAVAIEPSPWAYPVLEENVKLNPERNIKPLQVFAGETTGLKVECGRDWKHCIAGVFDKGTEKHTATTIKLDDLVEEADCMKLDVEGYELKVLRGATELIAKCKPMLFLEFHVLEIPLHGDTLQDLYNLLRDYDYGIEHYNGEVVKEFTNETWNRVLCT